MPGWIITAALAAVVALVLLAAGGPDPVVILVVMAVWFVVLAGLALAIETGVQALGRIFRRG